MDQILARLAQKVTLPLLAEFQRLSRRLAFVGAALAAFGIAGVFFIGAIFIYLSAQYSPLLACIIIGSFFAVTGLLALIVVYFAGSGKTSPAATTSDSGTDAEPKTDADAAMNLAIPGLIARSIFAPLIQLLGTVIKTMLLTSLANAKAKRNALKQTAKAAMEKPVDPLASDAEAPPVRPSPPVNKKRNILRYTALAVLGGLALGGIARGEHNKRL